MTRIMIPDVPRLVCIALVIAGLLAPGCSGEFRGSALEPGADIDRTQQPVRIVRGFEGSNCMMDEVWGDQENEDPCDLTPDSDIISRLVDAVERAQVQIWSETDEGGSMNAFLHMITPQCREDDPTLDTFCSILYTKLSLLLSHASFLVDTYGLWARYNEYGELVDMLSHDPSRHAAGPAPGLFGFGQHIGPDMTQPLEWSMAQAESLSRDLVVQMIAMMAAFMQSVVVMTDEGPKPVRIDSLVFLGHSPSVYEDYNPRRITGAELVALGIAEMRACYSHMVCEEISDPYCDGWEDCDSLPPGDGSPGSDLYCYEEFDCSANPPGDAEIHWWELAIREDWTNNVEAAFCAEVPPPTYNECELGDPSCDGSSNSCPGANADTTLIYAFRGQAHEMSEAPHRGDLAQIRIGATPEREFTSAYGRVFTKTATNVYYVGEMDPLCQPYLHRVQEDQELSDLEASYLLGVDCEGGDIDYPGNPCPDDTCEDTMRFDDCAVVVWGPETRREHVEECDESVNEKNPITL